MPGLANFFVPCRHTIAQALKNTVHNSAVGHFCFALFAHLEATIVCGGQLEREQMAGFVAPLLGAQAQQLSAAYQPAFCRVVHPVAFKMRAKAMCPAIDKLLTQALQIYMQIFALNFKAHTRHLYLR